MAPKQTRTEGQSSAKKAENTQQWLTSREAQKLSYGVVKNAGVPQDYEQMQTQVQLSSGNKLDYDDSMPIVTTLPNLGLGATLEKFPDGWTECLISGYLKKKIVNTPGFPAAIPRPPIARHRIAESPGKGLGMFAACNIKPGELVLAERPLIIAPRAIFGVRVAGRVPRHYTDEQYRQVTMFERERNLNLVTGRMAPERLEPLMSLANCHLQDGSGPILGIIRTNGFQAEEIRDKANTSESYYSVVCNELSRMNHSCSPNVARHWDTASFSMQIFAVRAIKEGEEITTEYCDLLAPAAQRQAELAPYGISQCVCPSCSNPAVSDPLRARIRVISRKMDDAGGWMNLDFPEKPDVKPLLGDLITIAKEGLEELDEYGYILWELFKTYATLQDSKNMLAYRQKHKAWKAAIYPDDAPEYEAGIDDLLKLMKFGNLSLNKMMKGKGKAA